MENEKSEDVVIENDGFKSVKFKTTKIVCSHCKTCDKDYSYPVDDETCYSCKWEEVRKVNKEYFDLSFKRIQQNKKNQKNLNMALYFCFVFIAILIGCFIGLKAECFFVSGYIFSTIERFIRGYYG